MPVIEEIPEIVKITTTMIPALRNVQLIRGLVIPLSSTGDMNQAKALEQYQSEVDKKKRVRQKLRDDLNKRVIKVKDALQCVEDTLGSGAIGISFAKSLLNVINPLKTPGSATDMMDLLYGPIQECMIKKALTQTQKRKYQHRVYMRRQGRGPGAK